MESLNVSQPEFRDASAREDLPDERPQRRREYSGAGSTLGLAALIVLTVAAALWWFQVREDNAASLDDGGFGIVPLPGPGDSPGRPAAARPGRAAPNWLLADEQGAGVRLSDFRGSWVVLNFWTASCDPCRREAPALQALAERARTGPAPLVVVGVNQQEPASKLRQYRETFGLSYRLVSDLTGEVSQAYGVGADVPMTFVIDPDGLVQKVYGARLVQRDFDEIDGMVP